MVDEEDRLKVQLFALTHSPQGHVDDTRFEKLLDRLTLYITNDSKLNIFIENGGLDSLEKGVVLEDARVVSVALRLVGLLSSLPLSPSHPLLPNQQKINKLMESLLSPQNIDMNSDALIRNACLIGLATSLSSPASVDWVTSYERSNRLVAFIFRSFSDSSVFVARSATQLLCELVKKGPEVENRLMESGLKRHIDISISEVPKFNNNNISDDDNILSPPPLHHNKICLIDLSIAVHQNTSPSLHPSLLDFSLSLSSLLGLLMDSDRHVRSRMVEAIQIIGVNNILKKEKMETDLYGITNKLFASGEGDFILTGIELVGALNSINTISTSILQKLFDLVIGVIVPVFGKVVSISLGDVERISPVKVDLPQTVLLQSVLECFKNIVSHSNTNILPGTLAVDLVIYGLSGGDSHKLVYIRECRPAYELAALILSQSHLLSSLPYPSPSLSRSVSPSTTPDPWVTPHHVQRLLHALLAGLSRSWSSFSVKTVVSLLGNGKMEGKIFQEFGEQLKESVTKGFASEESESREHVVSFIGTLYKEDTSSMAVEYYLNSGFHKIVANALNDSDTGVRTAALDSLKFICLEQSAWSLIVTLPSGSLPSLIASFSPLNNTSAPAAVKEPTFLQQVVHLLYDEDPYVQRASIGLLMSWTTAEHTKPALLFLIWDPKSGLYEGINHALHRSDWDAQVQSIQLLHAISSSLGMLSFFAINAHTLVLEMIKNCEERVSQKEAYATLCYLRTFIDKHNGDPSLLLFLPPITLDSDVGNSDHFKKELLSFHNHIHTLELDAMLQGLSDEHLYDEDEEEDLVLRYQDIQNNDDMDCD